MDSRVPSHPASMSYRCPGTAVTPDDALTYFPSSARSIQNRKTPAGVRYTIQPLATGPRSPRAVRTTARRTARDAGRFTQAADEAAASRVFAGQHFRSDE